jgi:DNA polymerase V
MDRPPQGIKATEIRACAVGAAQRSPLIQDLIQAGFPSPAEGLPTDSLDLNEYLTRNQPGTFLMRVAGESMVLAGIFDGDLLVVDRSAEASSGDVVVAVLDGEFTVKRLFVDGARCELRAENPRYAPIRLNAEETLQVWGVVRHVIHSL